MENKRNDIHAWIIYGVALIVVLFGLLITPSCTKLPTPEGQVFVIPGDQSSSYVSVKHFEYNGHKYIQFGNCNNRSIVHDPDCPCHND